MKKERKKERRRKRRTKSCELRVVTRLLFSSWERRGNGGTVVVNDEKEKRGQWESYTQRTIDDGIFPSIIRVYYETSSDFSLWNEIVYPHSGLSFSLLSLLPPIRLNSIEGADQ